MRKVLITGTAGFIGFHLAKLLLKNGDLVKGFDGMTDYYDVRLKQRRHAHLLQNNNFSCGEGMLEDAATFDKMVDDFCSRWRVRTPIKTKLNPQAAHVASRPNHANNGAIDSQITELATPP